MATPQGQTSNEPEQLARKFFVLTTLGVAAFLTAVMLVVRYMPSNDGPEPAPVITYQHLAAKP